MEKQMKSEQDWRDDAECLDKNPELFFPLGNKSPTAQEQIRQALIICGRCAVREQCLSWAVEQGLEYGIFGGKTEQERRAEKQRLKRRELARKAAEATRQGIVEDIELTTEVVDQAS